MSNVKTLLAALLKSYDEHKDIIKPGRGNQLNRGIIIEETEKLRRLLFPGFFGKKTIADEALEYFAGNLLEDIHYNLSRQISGALYNCIHCDHPGAHCCGYDDCADETKRAALAEDLCYRFLSALPEIRAMLDEDVDAAFSGDPAAFNKDEIISSYPGIFAITVYRLAHTLDMLQVPLIPRIMTEYAHSLTGIDIHPGAVIGRRFFIDHGTGIVIGQTTIIGNNVKVYQCVTLGGLSTKGGQALRDKKRHPTIEDNCVIYAGASILGGGTVVGEGSVISSNAFITQSVPPGSKIVFEPKNEGRD
jgi:serine O-acetyltransferase